ncbi:hypothetical protein [Paracoccus sp. 228]|uniref:hypothetical protein n=1 Tax=Paracoccus sp. 228 TaxID=1192054 RepID=UPI000AA4D3F8|nr:hypothetical protein [Paracoccus sp. 228]
MPTNPEYDINQLRSETRKLNAETAKLMAVQRKLEAEELLLQRQHQHLPAYWVQIILALWAGAGLLSALDLLINR